MKPNRLSFILLLLLPLWASAQKVTRLEGEVVNGAQEAVLKYDPLMLELPETAKATVKDNKFVVEIKLSKAVEAVLELGEKRIPLYLEPGDMQVLGFDASGHPKMSGTGAANSSCLQAFLDVSRSYFDTAAMHSRVLTEAIDPLELDLFEARKTQEKLCKELLVRPNLSAGFKDMLEAEVKYNYDRWLLAYPVRRANERKTETEVRNLPGAYEEAFDPNLLNNPSALGSRAYREYVWYYVSYFSAKENNYLKWKDQNAALGGKCNFASTRLSGPVATWFYAYSIVQYRRLAAPGTVERWMDAMQKAEGGAELAKPVQALVTEAQVAQAGTAPKGNEAKNPSPEEKYKFKMVGLDGKERQLSEFAGKVVYIDFWASWCGPCRQQFPYSKQLKEKAHATLSKKQQKELVFLYISIDQEDAAWRKAIVDLGIEGEHAFSNAKWPDGAGAFFQVSGIPRYMIMDKTGNVVQSNAPRPSAEDIWDTLLKYLQ